MQPPDRPCEPFAQDRRVDLVVSGINRGDNAGLHVIYSGTVGAAREAACKVPNCSYCPPAQSQATCQQMAVTVQGARSCQLRKEG